MAFRCGRCSHAFYGCVVLLGDLSFCLELCFKLRERWQNSDDTDTNKYQLRQLSVSIHFLELLSVSPDKYFHLVTFQLHLEVVLFSRV